MTASTLRSQILDAKDVGEETVTVPEWGDAVIRVRGLELGERSDLVMEVRGEDGEIDLTLYYARLLQLTARDPESGERIFEPDDAGLLQKKNPAAVDRVVKVALRLSGLTKTGDVEEGIEKAGKASSRKGSGASTS